MARRWQSAPLGAALALALLHLTTPTKVAAADYAADAATATGGAKLYFRHGTVSSAKTLALLAVAHTYEVGGGEV